MNIKILDHRAVTQSLCTIGAAFLFLLSTAAAQEVSVNMVNQGNLAVDVNWVDENGNEVAYANLPSGASYDQPTYPGHLWHFRSNGQLVAKYTATNSAAQQIVIGGKAMPKPPVPPQPVPQRPVQPGGNVVQAGALQAPIDFRRPDIAAINAAILAETNRQRANHRLPALQLSPQLNAAAQMHANDMVSQNFFSHTNPYDQSKASMQQRIQMSGFAASNMAENIATAFGIQYVANTPVYTGGPGVFMKSAQGRPIPPHSPTSFAAAVVKQWMESPGHRKNILSQNTFLGVGVTFYPDPNFNGMMTGKAVQVFGTN